MWEDILYRERKNKQKSKRIDDELKLTVGAAFTSEEIFCPWRR